MFSTTAFFSGLGLCAGLIMAIGAQNSHVLRCGLRRQHVGLTVLVCILIDGVLIGLGVAGMGVVVQSSPVLLALARWGGAAFLLWYGLRSWRAVLAGARLELASSALPVSRTQALLTVCAMSLLNPHVYLDTVVLIGAVGGSFAPDQRASFALGAVAVSVIWFCALGYGATRLSRLFARPVAWRCIDALTGSTMLAMSASIAFGS
ncbi:MAG: LysE/ArgO family amino acid transporter [Pseudomonadota bacterium]